ncbi:hypothetical protein E2C01_023865 [Portunus trituberculatus]|uniref:Uncharacterized protein n=1 Tax=Portunus trituberculatus TaxID=210409 RepID=A0A5B7EAE4_PORTR|nr:hypothetical protein [Portunus trituberculatus]
MYSRTLGEIAPVQVIVCLRAADLVIIETSGSDGGGSGGSALGRAAAASSTTSCNSCDVFLIKVSGCPSLSLVLGWRMAGGGEGTPYVVPLTPLNRFIIFLSSSLLKVILVLEILITCLRGGTGDGTPRSV